MTTDTEHEAREYAACSPRDWTGAHFLELLRLLDKARAEISGLREALAAHQDELGMNGLAEQLAGAGQQIKHLKAEIATLRTAVEAWSGKCFAQATEIARLARVCEEWGSQDLLRQRDIETLQSEIARLTASPGASAMDRARSIISKFILEGHFLTNGTPSGKSFEEISSAVARAVEHAEREARAPLEAEIASTTGSTSKS
jgi:chromosome segregation ATPase